MTESHELHLPGLDGSNPLGFLAALGTLRTMHTSHPLLKLDWTPQSGNWCARLSGCEITADTFSEELYAALEVLPLDHFRLSRKWPFKAADYRAHLRAIEATCTDRRSADYFAAMGCEAVTKNETFLDSRFRMVRAGDSAGNGFPVYVLRCQESLTIDALDRTLFSQWDYMDDILIRGGVPSFRWDPNEDSQHALQWGEPAKQPKKCMLGANRLAIEALPYFPTVPIGSRLETTGFSRLKRSEFFTWPIWNVPIGHDTIRTIVSLNELQHSQPDRQSLSRRGVIEVFRGEQYAPSVYYRNFRPARAV